MVLRGHKCILYNILPLDSHSKQTKYSGNLFKSFHSRSLLSFQFSVHFEWHCFQAKISNDTYFFNFSCIIHLILQYQFPSHCLPSVINSLGSNLVHCFHCFWLSFTSHTSFTAPFPSLPPSPLFPLGLLRSFFSSPPSLFSPEQTPNFLEHS